MIFTLAWRYWRGRGLRSLLTALAVVCGVMLTFGLNGVTPTLTKAFEKNMLNASGKTDLSVAEKSGQTFPASVADELAAIPGIAAVSPYLQQPAPLPKRPVSDPSVNALAQVTVVGIVPDKAARVRDYTVSAGRMITAGDAAAMVANSDVAGQLGLTLGDTLELPAAAGVVKFRLVGILSGTTMPGEEQVVVSLSAAQQLFGAGARINAIDATFSDGTDRAQVEQLVKARLSDKYTIGGLTSNSSLLSSMEMASTAFMMFGLFAMATAAFIILNSFRMLVAERRRDVGMLRAIGMKRRTVVGMFLVESLFQGVVGTGLGLLAGWGMASGIFVLMAPITKDLMHIDLGGPIFTPETWAVSIILGVGVTILAAVLPARAAGKVTPMEAMRPQVGEKYTKDMRRRGWIGLGILVVSLFGLFSRDSGLVGLASVLVLVAIALAVPAVVIPVADVAIKPLQAVFGREGPIARSNIQRNPGRSGVTVTAVMLGMAAIVGMITVINSIFTGYLAYLDKSMSSDYLVIPSSIVLSQGNVAAGPGLARQLGETPGIAAVSTLRVGQGQVGGLDVQVIGIDPAKYLDVASLEWNTGSSDNAVRQLASGRWVIANGIYASSNALTPGQAIVLDTPNGLRTYYLAGIGNDYLNAKLATLYTSQENLQRDFNVADDLLVMANRAANADPDTVTARVQRVVAGYPAFNLYEPDTWKAEQSAIFDMSMIMFYVLIAALAVPSLLALINTLSISVLARTREIGMLRAVGATRRQVKRMVLAESLLLSLIGTVVGAAAGVILGYALVLALSAIGWEMPYSFPTAGIVTATVVGIAFGMIASSGPAKSASRLNVVDALHHE
ncbi:MAG: FtsX-like permease family protein [Propionibacteriaceae bacterium]|jgi:putative ABC transport system permease protein|nr:FtsX-like permease family protein [Propionibacteriaceae bacterium]